MALVWAQFSAYHEDRCLAVARRLGGRAKVIAVEVASASNIYPWQPSQLTPGVRKATLFPGESFESIGTLRRFWRQFALLRRCDVVFVGIGYNEPDIVALSFVLRLVGVKVFVMSDSKFGDTPRSITRELGKACLLSAYRGAIVAGRRQLEYFRFLGFIRRPLMPGYDGVGVERIRNISDQSKVVPFEERGFLYLGRFVAKKNLPELLAGYAIYAARAGGSARRLIMAGSGPLEPALRTQAEALGISHLVDMPGFVDSTASALLLSKSLALILISRVDQWGLVVNEAAAAGLPVIVAPPVGACDLLVRNLLNGFVVENGSPAGLAEAMQTLAGDEATWRKMAVESAQRAWLGDSERLADAVEVLLFADSEPARQRIAILISAMGGPVDTRYDP